MPYVPSTKTDGKSQDRILIDEQVELVAKGIAEETAAYGNFRIIKCYKQVFADLACDLSAL